MHATTGNKIFGSLLLLIRAPATAGGFLHSASVTNLRHSVRLSSHTDYSLIKRGEVFVTEGWLPSGLVSELRADALALRAGGEFSAGGAPSQIEAASGRVVCDVTPALGGDRAARATLGMRIDSLCVGLGRALGRELVCAEQYYSVAATGAALALHMDERHEETKGAAAWEAADRRSISWLLYLSGDRWGEVGGAGAGGGFRAYCRSAAAGRGVGAHDGNLQVGWLASNSSDEPVFLDCWVKAPGVAAEDATADAGVVGGSPRWRPLSALYRIAEAGSGGRDYLSRRFGPDSASWPDFPDGAGVTESQLTAALRAQLCTPAHRAAFSGVEHVPHPRLRTVDVAPRGGTLVLFDSVSVPHEVLPTTAGERVAMAGWFHEPQQPFPDWHGT